MSDQPILAEDEGGVSFAPLFRAIWIQRRRITMLWAVFAVVVVIGAALYFMTRPAERTARVEFRLVFAGAERGQYPNGTPFALPDLIAAPIITKVYQNNELERYLSFERFKSGLFVYESNREIEMLRYEYDARLSDTKLLAVDRERMEAEFRQKLAAQRVPQLSLQFVVSSRTNTPPSQVMEKVLNDVLAEWAEYTAVQRGALGYQIELLTPNVILKDTLNTQTLLIRYDMLRRHVSRVLEQVTRLMELPGANTTRTGKDNLSLLDLKTNLEDVLEFQLNPLIRRRLIYALPPNEVALNVLYLEDRLVELQRFRTNAEARKQQLEGVLATFRADAVPSASAGATGATEGQDRSAPPLSDSFLDRLIDIAGRSSAMGYRTGLTDKIIAVGQESLSVDQDIAFYQDTIRLLKASGAIRPEVLKPEDVLGAFDDIQKRVVEVLQLTNDAYATISAATLNPRSVLYLLTGPYSMSTIRPVEARAVATMVVLLLIVALVGIAVSIGGTAWLKQTGFLRM